MFHKSIGCAVKLYNAETAGSQTTILREAIAEQINEDLTEEAIRTLYVALTRARERLYVTGTLNGQWQNAKNSAQLIHRANRHAILGCSSYLAWIMAALGEAGNMPSACVLKHITHEEIITSSEVDPVESIDSKNPEVNAVENTSVLSYATVLRQHETFSYELSALEGLPTKIAASKIVPDLLDRLEDEQGIEQAIEIMKNSSMNFSSVLSSKKNVRATDIGTATHAFLQFCNYNELLTNGIDAECARLVAEGFMDESTVSIIQRKQLEDFLKSDLMREILGSTRIWRERKFGIEIPLSEFTLSRKNEDILSNHSIFVQGSIDLLIQTVDGKLLLIDYKTDKIAEEIRSSEAELVKRMISEHGNQLGCYRRAACQLFGKYPDSTLIYSLPLGRMIEIPFD
jgi:ATP-dependent helicase/nuclease subunit A